MVKTTANTPNYLWKEMGCLYFFICIQVVGWQSDGYKFCECEDTSYSFGIYSITLYLSCIQLPFQASETMKVSLTYLETGWGKRGMGMNV